MKHRIGFVSIKNSLAHHALSDALTTAKVYLARFDTNDRQERDDVTLDLLMSE